MRDRGSPRRLRQHRTRITQRIREIEAVDFFNMLTGSELLETTEAHLPEHRERLYPPTVTLSMFMMQALREAKVGGQVLVTTMLDQRSVRKGELNQLYQRRWNVELDIRNIKTTLGWKSFVAAHR